MHLGQVSFATQLDDLRMADLVLPLRSHLETP